jgi:hypothetical protein
MIASSSRLAIGRLRRLSGGRSAGGIGEKDRRETATGRLSQAKLPIYKNFSDLARTHQFRESLSQRKGANVPNSLKVDIEQAHRNDAELRYLAVHQAQNRGMSRPQAFRKYNSTIG